MVGILVSFWDSLFSGAFSVSFREGKGGDLVGGTARPQNMPDFSAIELGGYGIGSKLPQSLTMSPVLGNVIEL